MPEFLLILACAKQMGCAETSAQYRSYNPTPFQRAEHYAEELNKLILTSYWGPVLAYGMGREGTIKLHKNVGLTLSQKEAKVLFAYEF